MQTTYYYRKNGLVAVLLCPTLDAPFKELAVFWETHSDSLKTPYCPIVFGDR